MNQINSFDRLPPYSTDAEICVIASMMLAMPDDPMIAAVYGLIDGGDFFSTDHQIIFDTLKAMRQRGSKVDAILLGNELQSRKLLDEVGGLDYIGKVLQTIPSAAHGEHYAKIVLANALKRRGIAIANELLRDAFGPTEMGTEANMLVDAASKLVDGAMRGKGSEVHHVGTEAQKIYDGRTRPQTFDRIKTGLVEFDDMIGGLPIGGHVIVAGKPGMAKSALVKQLALNIAMDGRPAGIISVEETSPKIASNMMASLSGVMNNRIRFNTANERDWDTVKSILPSLQELPIYTVDSACKISDIISIAELLVKKYQCEAIFVDHIHLIDAEPEKHQNREREVSKISGMLKMTWKRLHVAGVTAAQLNRSSGRDRPTKENLRDSGSLEQDGDIVVLLHREDYYRKQDMVAAGGEIPLDGVLELIVDKNKDGAVGTAAVRFEEATQRIYNLNPGSEHI